MRWQRADAPREPSERTAPRTAVLAAPLVLVSIFSLVVRSADSSNGFHLDQDRVLEALKERIDASTPPVVVGEAVLEAPELREVHETVRRGDTFSRILHRVAIISAEEVSRWLAASREHPSLSRLQPDHQFTFLVPSGTDRLAGLQYEISPSRMLVMREEGDGIVSHVERLPEMVDVHVASGTIDSSLYAAAIRNGVPDSVVSAIVDIFGWDIDFTSDLRKGDRFRVAYEEYHDGKGNRTQDGRVLAVELDARRAQLRAVYFEMGADGGNYYSPDGRPFGRNFLRYPLEFSRISSHFSQSRFHPVLGIRRPHLGVDFAAPMGTAVRSIGAGRVTYAGWKGANGRFVKIDHGNGIESSYSHLKSIARGIRKGGRVRMGQVVGAVGASGLATGPHLHFALYRNGIYVNPMSVKLPASPPLADRHMADFERARDELLQQLAAIDPSEDSGITRVARIGAARSTASN